MKKLAAAWTITLGLGGTLIFILARAAVRDPELRYIIFVIISMVACGWSAIVLEGHYNRDARMERANEKRLKEFGEKT